MVWDVIMEGWSPLSHERVAIPIGVVTGAKTEAEAIEVAASKPTIVGYRHQQLAVGMTRKVYRADLIYGVCGCGESFLPPPNDPSQTCPSCGISYTR